MQDDSDWPDEHWLADDEPDPDWPDDWPATAPRDQADWPPATAVPRQGARSRRTLALALTATIALGAGAGAVYLYRSVERAAVPSATAPGSTSPAAPGSPAAGGTATSMQVLGRVVAVGRDTVTVGGGPFPSVSARVTSATRFTGADQSLAQVRVGDIVAVQISESGGAASVISLQDPASQESS